MHLRFSRSSALRASRSSLPSALRASRSSLSSLTLSAVLLLTSCAAGPQSAAPDVPVHCDRHHRPTAGDAEPLARWRSPRSSVRCSLPRCRSAATDGKTHLAYELMLTNITGQARDADLGGRGVRRQDLTEPVRLRAGRLDAGDGHPHPDRHDRPRADRAGLARRHRRRRGAASPPTSATASVCRLPQPQPPLTEPTMTETIAPDHRGQPQTGHHFAAAVAETTGSTPTAAAA